MKYISDDRQCGIRSTESVLKIIRVAIVNMPYTKSKPSVILKHVIK